MSIVEFKTPKMATINEAAEITGLAKFHIRQLALQNKITHLRAGKKFLINMEKLIEYLNEGDAKANTPKCSGISRIEK